MQIRIFLIILAFILRPSFASADLYVSFMATPTTLGQLPGHAFVCLEVKLQSGVKEDCFGFYPKSVIDVLNGEGVVENEISGSRDPDRFSDVTVSLRHAISEETRLAILAEIKKWSGETYNLLVSNCGDMMFAVAKSAGLRIPDRSTILRPTDFVEGLKLNYWRSQWVSDDVGSRFLLKIEGDQAEWLERSATGHSVNVRATITFSDSGALLFRENTHDILEVLGFQKSIIGQILLAHPKPSFLRLQRFNDKLKAEWNGLVITKDVNAKLRQLIQPGTLPPKLYTFSRIL